MLLAKRSFRHSKRSLACGYLAIKTLATVPILANLTLMGVSTRAQPVANERYQLAHGLVQFNLDLGAELLTLLALLDRSCAMRTRLAHMSDRVSGSAQIGQRERSR